MSNITVAEILKMHGNWIDSSLFVSLVAQKLSIGERMAYIRIKEAWHKKKEILRFYLPDRTILYGLPEFGPPKQPEAKPSEKLDILKIALEHGILKKEDVDSIATIDFCLQHPELIGLDDPEERKQAEAILKLMKDMELQKIQSLKELGSGSE